MKKRVVRAKNHLYEYDDGSTKIDSISGTYHLPLGHNSEEEISAIQSALGGIHNSYKEANHSDNCLSRILNDRLAENREWHFMTTGSEAVERAIMCAIRRKNTARNAKIIMIENAFHGKTFMTSFAHYPVDWLPPFEIIRIKQGEEGLEQIPEDFDALLFEPVQGWTGLATEDETMQNYRSACDRAGAMLIADEILCGIGRGGRPVYSQSAEPDILLLAKGMGAGIPISAVGFSERISERDRIPFVGWTSTHANNAFANTVAEILTPKVLDIAVEKVPEIERQWREAFKDIDGLHNINGALIYIDTQARTGRSCDEIVKSLYSDGIICANHDPYIRMAPCYTMPRQAHCDLIFIVKEIFQ
jgi:acetylornithine/succinyldiaminopimelate/putrescine aminotransferase